LLAVCIAVPLTLVVWQVFFCMEVGMAKEIGGQEPRISGQDYSSLPPSVVEDATRLAREIVGNSQDKSQDLVAQLLATYRAAKESDVVIIFNSGGWGWNQLEKTPGWNSIVGGVRAKLDSLGYSSMVLNYQRTSRGLLGCLRELVAMVNRYPERARELAGRVEFLTDHIPDLRVIIAGESTGVVISDSTMAILRDNQRVYSVQTGTPFWHRPEAMYRTLLMNSNGKAIDTFSYGKLSTMVWATVKGWFGASSPEEDPGTILTWLRAPGHNYSWEYPGVSSAVNQFLEANFKAKT